MLGALRATLAGLRPEELLAEVIRQGGDADTVGAITGAIFWARYGADWIQSAN
ncbi:MAG: ADP-ribosylglycohydrolase family protein [Chloracidobacterium sp.]|nr:ADP-ribosylglycohydrolase family protein [Chloracidobacterium sp.]